MASHHMKEHFAYTYNLIAKAKRKSTQPKTQDDNDLEQRKDEEFLEQVHAVKIYIVLFRSNCNLIYHLQSFHRMECEPLPR